MNPGQLSPPRSGAAGVRRLPYQGEVGAVPKHDPRCVSDLAPGRVVDRKRDPQFAIAHLCCRPRVEAHLTPDRCSRKLSIPPYTVARGPLGPCKRPSRRGTTGEKVQQWPPASGLPVPNAIRYTTHSGEYSVVSAPTFSATNESVESAIVLCRRTTQLTARRHRGAMTSQKPIVPPGQVQCLLRRPSPASTMKRGRRELFEARRKQFTLLTIPLATPDPSTARSLLGWPLVANQGRGRGGPSPTSPTVTAAARPSAG